MPPNADFTSTQRAMDVLELIQKIHNTPDECYAAFRRNKGDLAFLAFRLVHPGGSLRDLYLDLEAYVLKLATKLLMPPQIQREYLQCLSIALEHCAELRCLFSISELTAVVETLRKLIDGEGTYITTAKTAEVATAEGSPTGLVAQVIHLTMENQALKSTVENLHTRFNKLCEKLPDLVEARDNHARGIIKALADVLIFQ